MTGALRCTVATPSHISSQPAANASEQASPAALCATTTPKTTSAAAIIPIARITAAIEVSFITPSKTQKVRLS